MSKCPVNVLDFRFGIEYKGGVVGRPVVNVEVVVK